MSFLKKIIFIFSIVIVIYPAKAQLEKKLSETWRWVKYSTDAGLPSNHISEILQTNSGDIWVKTPKGLAWFNGYKWIPVSNPSMPLSPNYSICTGEKSELYVACSNNLFVYNKSGVILIKVEYQGRPIRVFDVVLFGQNQLLILAQDTLEEETELFLYRITTGILSKFKKPTGNAKTFDDIYVFLKAHPEDIWLNSYEGLYRWNGNKWFLELHKKSLFPMELTKPHSDINMKGLFSIIVPDELRGTYQYSKSMNSSRIITKKKILSISPDFSPKGEAIAIFTDRNISIYRNDRFMPLLNIPRQLEQAICYKFLSNSDLLVGTTDGLFLCRLSSNLWEYLQTGKKEFDNINEIIVRKDNSIWCATAAGLTIYDKSGAYKTIHEIDGKELMGLTGLIEDNEGNIWISSGAYFTGTYRWNGKVWKYFGEKEGFPAGRVHKIFKDSQNRLWFISLSDSSSRKGKGTYIYDNGKFHKFKFPKELFGIRMYAFAEGLDKALWFGSMTGLHRYKNGIWKTWSEEDSLRPGGVFTLAIAPDGKLWFGNRMNGIGFVDKDNLHYVKALDRNDIFSVWNMAFDKKGKLWIATAFGLISYYNDVVTKYSIFSGINNLRIWPILVEDNRILIGTISNGVNILNFDERKFPNPKVYFEEPIIQKDRVHIFWKVFSYFGHIPNDEIEIRYRVDNEPWSDWSNIREIFLDELTSGKHKFQIQSKGMFGDYFFTGDSIEFDIPSPFYYRFEFVLPVTVVLLITLIAFIYYYRYKTHKKTNLILEEKNTEIVQANYELLEKNQTITNQKEELEKKQNELQLANNTKDLFFSILAHDLKNPFGGMKNLIELLSQEYEDMDSSELKEIFDTLEISSKNIYELLDNLLQWARASMGRIEYIPNKINIKEITDNIINLFKVTAEKKNITLFSEIIKPLYCYADSNMINTVIRNLISNSLKFTPEYGMVKIFSDNKSDNIEITIFDTGIGIPDENIDYIFNSDNNFSTIGTAKESGTGLGLMLCKEFVEKNGGKIWIENSSGNGTYFKFTVPI